MSKLTKRANCNGRTDGRTDSNDRKASLLKTLLKTYSLKSRKTLSRMSSSILEALNRWFKVRYFIMKFKPCNSLSNLKFYLNKPQNGEYFKI